MNSRMKGGLGIGVVEYWSDGTSPKTRLKVKIITRETEFFAKNKLVFRSLDFIK